MTPDASRGLLTIHAERDAGVSGRVLGLVGISGQVPTWFSARHVGDDSLKIVIEVTVASADHLGLLGRKLLNIPSVLSVDVDLLGSGRELRP